MVYSTGVIKIIFPGITLYRPKGFANYQKSDSFFVIIIPITQTWVEFLISLSLMFRFLLFRH